jgi:hypothetical protein
MKHKLKKEFSQDLERAVLIGIIDQMLNDIPLRFRKK